MHCSFWKVHQKPKGPFKPLGSHHHGQLDQHKVVWVGLPIQDPTKLCLTPSPSSLQRPQTIKLPAAHMFIIIKMMMFELKIMMELNWACFKLCFHHHVEMIVVRSRKGVKWGNADPERTCGWLERLWMIWRFLGSTCRAGEGEGWGAQCPDYQTRAGRQAQQRRPTPHHHQVPKNTSKGTGTWTLNSLLHVDT